MIKHYTRRSLDTELARRTSNVDQRVFGHCLRISFGLLLVILTQSLSVCCKEIIPEPITMQPGFTPGPLDTPAGRLATANAGFSFALYKELSQSGGHHSNLFFSPGSISVAMAMTYLGARGNTAAEMRKTLNLESIGDDTVHGSFSELQEAYDKKTDSIKLHMANRLYVNKGFDLVKQYLDDSKKHYGAEVAQVDYVKDSDGARKQINSWVEEKTANKIKDILPGGSVDPLTRLILVNAVYFKGDWNLKFDPAKTQEADFTSADNSKSKVQMMFQKEKFNFGVNHQLHTQALELPYANNSLSLVILLPEAGKFDLFQEKFTLDDIISCEKSFRMISRDVHVSLPRFRLEDSFSLGETLSNMGMKDLFSESAANLSGLDKSNSLFVSKVLHKAFLDVNEEGSEAAAATAVKMQLRMMPKEFHFRADHPFMFFIRENSTRSILFMGRYANPAGGAGKEEL